MAWWRRWFGGRRECMVCRKAVPPGEWTCGEEGCEMVALGGQAMMASLVADQIMRQEVKVARRVRFRTAPPSSIWSAISTR